jgi:hypothetical protein
MGMIIGRSPTPLNSTRTMRGVRRRDDNSRGNVQNVHGDSSAEIAEDLRSALEQIESVLGDLQQRAAIIERKTVTNEETKRADAAEDS